LPRYSPTRRDSVPHRFSCLISCLSSYIPSPFSPLQPTPICVICAKPLVLSIKHPLIPKTPRTPRADQPARRLPEPAARVQQSPYISRGTWSGTQAFSKKGTDASEGALKRARRRRIRPFSCGLCERAKDTVQVGRVAPSNSVCGRLQDFTGEVCLAKMGPPQRWLERLQSSLSVCIPVHSWLVFVAVESVG